MSSLFYYSGLTIPQLAGLYRDGDNGAMAEIQWREFVAQYVPEIYATGDISPILYNPQQGGGRKPAHGDPPNPPPMPRPISAGGGYGGGSGGSWMPVSNGCFELVFE